MNETIKRNNNNQQNDQDRLRTLERENNDLRRKYDETHHEYSSKSMSYEHNIGILNQENETLKRKSSNIDDLNRKVTDMERLLGLSDV